MLTEGGSVVATGAAEGAAISETAGLADAADALSRRVASSATSPPVRNAATPTITHSSKPLFATRPGFGFRLAISRRSSSICRRSRITTVFSVRSERFLVPGSGGIFGAAGGFEPEGG
jgi:hypothetical protein